MLVGKNWPLLLKVPFFQPFQTIKMLIVQDRNSFKSNSPEMSFHEMFFSVAFRKEVLNFSTKYFRNFIFQFYRLQLLFIVPFLDVV